MMLFLEDYHNISLVFKAAQLMKQQNPTRVLAEEHKFHFEMLHLHVCFCCWVGYVWHRIFILDKGLGQHSFLLFRHHFFFLTSRGGKSGPFLFYQLHGFQHAFLESITVFCVS